MASLQEAYDLALGLHQAGRMGEAAVLYDRILDADPGQAFAWYYSGLLAAQNGAFDEALGRMGRAVARAPDVGAFHLDRGKVLTAAGRDAEAIAAFRRTAALQPDSEEAYFRLAQAIEQRGDGKAAADAYGCVSAFRPGDAALHAKRGQLLSRIGHLAAAAEAFEAATTAQPDWSEAWQQLGDLRLSCKRPDRAEEAYRQALRLSPESAGIHHGLGNALEDQGMAEAAMTFQRRAIALDPILSAAHHALGNLLSASGYRFGAAISAFNRVLRLLPRAAQAFLGRGNAQFLRGEVDEAVESYRAALEVSPGYADARTALLFALTFKENADPDDVFREHRRFDEILLAPLGPPPADHRNDRDPDRPVRVGYVSPNFYGHPCGHFVLPVITHHDRSQVRVTCYATSPVRDDWTDLFERHSERFVVCGGWNDDRLAAAIRADGIDILVNCSGHMAGHRLPVFGRKPAPIQISYPLYPNTTGLSAIDYRIMDRHFAPPWADRWHSEKLVRLPDAHIVYMARPSVFSPPEEPPCRRAGFVTFGSFNNMGKLGGRTIAAWADVLARVPGARLMLKWRGLAEAETADKIRRTFAGHSVAPDRLILVNWSADSYEHYAFVDIALDPLVANGGTTTCDALWMGVPVVSMVGRTPFSRVGLCHLTNIGLPELLVDTVQDYVALATALACDYDRLEAVRRGMRARMASSPLMDAPRYTRHLETAYRTMWRRWCAGLPPEPITVAG